MSKSEHATERYHVPAVMRALDLLELLAEHNAGLSMQDIVIATEWPKNTVYRNLVTLVDRGYVRQETDSRRYRLSQRWLGIAFAAFDEPMLIELCRPHMLNLRDQTEETVLLGALIDDHSGTEGVVLEQVVSVHPFKISIDVGARFLLHASAPGKCLLSALPEQRQAALVKHLTFEPLTEKTITDPATFLDELQLVATRGFGLDIGEYMVGAHCVGAPIIDRHGYPIAALWITGPSFRLSAEAAIKLGATVQHAAQQISLDLRSET